MRTCIRILGVIAFILALILAAQRAHAQQPASYTAQQYNVSLLDPPTPVANATVQRTGNPGSQTFYYWIVTNALVGNSTLAGPFGISQAPNTLNGSNFLSISWAQASNAITYDVLRTTTPTAPTGACNCAVATAVVGTSTTDQSNSLNTYTITSQDPSALGMAITNESLGAARSQMTMRANGVQLLSVTTPPNGNFIGGDFYRRYVSVGSGLQIPSTHICELDAYRGGQETPLPGTGTKTQWQCQRIEVQGRTLGETKGIEANVFKFGKGDNIGLYGTAIDYAGFYSSGSEGSEGGRFTSQQGDPNQVSGGTPIGTVAAVSSNQVTGTWSSGNANLGEQRPLINTSRSVYNTGTISSVVGSGSPVVCTVTGAATGWSALGTGAKTDLFLNITGNDGTANGNVKHVVPIISITDDTHLIVEYNQAELNQSCFGVTMVQSGAYNIYHGGTVTSLADPPAGSTNPIAVNLASGGSNFQVGDSIQQALGYNYHGRSIQAVLNRIVGEPNGGGFYVNNVSALGFRDAYRSSGAFQHGLLFDAGTLSGTLSLAGIQFDIPVGGALLNQTDTSAGSQVLIRQLTAGQATRDLAYNRTSDRWDFLNVPVNAASGFMVAGAAANGNCLVGNGTAFVSAACPGGGGAPGGAVGTLQWNGPTGVGGTFTGLLGSTSDNCQDMSAGGCNSNSNAIAITRSWANSVGGNAGHIGDSTGTWTGNFNVNTIAGGWYSRMVYNANGVSSGCGDCGVFFARSSDTGPNQGTIGQGQNYFSDFGDSNNPSSNWTKWTGFYNLNNTIASNVVRTFTDWSGFRNELETFSNANTTVTKETGFQTQTRNSLPTANVVKSFGLDVGLCSPGNLFLAGVFCNEETVFLSSILQNNVTLGAASAAPLTSQQPFGIKQNNFLSDNSTVRNILSTLTVSNGANGGTGIGIDMTVDNGGTGLPTSLIAGRFACSNSGSGTTTKCISVNVPALVNAGTLTDYSQIELGTALVGSITNTPFFLKQTDASAIGSLAGQLFLNGNTVFVTSNFTTAANTNLQNITGNGAGGFLAWALPKNTAVNVPFSCSLPYSQATGNAAVSFGISASVAPTQINASGEIYTSASVFAAGNLQGLNTTTATAIMTGTPSATGTVFNANFRGMIENPSQAASTINIMVKTATSGDAVTVNRGGTCSLGVV